PNTQDLRDAGRHDLASGVAIFRRSRKLAALDEVAEALGLRRIAPQKRKGFWKSDENLCRALRDAAARLGSPGVMPSKPELARLGPTSLATIVTSWDGGFPGVARLCGLSYVGPERLSRESAERAERVARAIQPLAEASLLTGAQIMVILRRAGL